MVNIRICSAFDIISFIVNLLTYFVLLCIVNLPGKLQFFVGFTRVVYPFMNTSHINTY